MKAEKILLWAQMQSTGVDFSVNGITFQISYLGKGFWKRYFHKGSHPTRGNVSQTEMQDALDKATTFTLYEGQKPHEVSRQEFEQMVASVFNF
ncbi:hypothetical protein H6776_02550 [Candidatus Nomurabacteria bacterium]|nr:hypothetical protein [Candidatus Nomurabacteria bacterium]